MANRPNRYYRGPPTDHFDGNRFFMPGHRMANGFRELLKWQRDGGRQAWPERVENALQPLPPARVDAGELHVTLIGQSTVLIQVAGLNILTDPRQPRPMGGPQAGAPAGTGAR